MRKFTVHDLKYELDSRGSHYFSRETMKFFGDTMRNFGVRRTTVETWHDSEPVEVWELYRRRPVKHGLFKSAYFSCADFSQVSQKGE